MHALYNAFLYENMKLIWVQWRWNFSLLQVLNTLWRSCGIPCMCNMYISMPTRPALTLTLDIYTYADQIYFSRSVNLVCSLSFTLSSIHFWVCVFYFLFSYSIAHSRFHSRMVPFFVERGRGRCYKATTKTDMQSIHLMAINNAILL